VAIHLVGCKIQILKDRNYAPAFAVAQIAKDFDIALDTAKVNEVPIYRLSNKFIRFVQLAAFETGK